MSRRFSHEGIRCIRQVIRSKFLRSFYHFFFQRSSLTPLELAQLELLQTGNFANANYPQPALLFAATPLQAAANYFYYLQQVQALFSASSASLSSSNESIYAASVAAEINLVLDQGLFEPDVLVVCTEKLTTQTFTHLLYSAKHAEQLHDRLSDISYKQYLGNELTPIQCQQRILTIKRLQQHINSLYNAQTPQQMTSAADMQAITEDFPSYRAFIIMEYSNRILAICDLLKQLPLEQINQHQINTHIFLEDFLSSCLEYFASQPSAPLHIVEGLIFFYNFMNPQQLQHPIPVSPYGSP
jgi:hypothetical protein